MRGVKRGATGLCLRGLRPPHATGRSATTTVRSQPRAFHPGGTIGIHVPQELATLNEERATFTMLTASNTPTSKPNGSVLGAPAETRRAPTPQGAKSAPS